MRLHLSFCKRRGEKTEFVNVKVPVTVKIRQYFIFIFLFAVNTFHDYFFAVDTMLHHQNTKRLYWFMLMVSRALLDNMHVVL